MNKYLYGLPEASRRWAQNLSKFFVSLGASPIISDRMCFRWHWEGEEMNFAVHVDDIVASASSSKIKEEFARNLLWSRVDVVVSDAGMRFPARLRRRGIERASELMS